jgi:two-component system, cell cycle response regulator DivK
MHKILLVEDNELNRDMLSRRLVRRGFTVTLAGDGQQALERVADDPPDLVLMDMSLPVMDGWEATRRIKASPNSHDIPVIALTAHAMAGDREKAMAAGCDDFDTKPVDFQRLTGKMEALLGSATPPDAIPMTGQRERVHLQRSARIEALPQLMALITDLCTRAGASNEVSQELQLVYEEACVNVIRHAYAGREPGPIEIDAWIADDRGQPAVVCSIRDEGPPFDPLGRALPDTTLAVEDRAIGGLGVLLMRRMSDRLLWRPAGPQGGNQLTIVKHLTPPPEGT